MDPKYEIKQWGCPTDLVGTLEELVRQCTDGDDYGRGALEAAAATADMTRECLARLLDVLVRSGAIKLADVPEILGYGDDSTIEVSR